MSDIVIPSYGASLKPSALYNSDKSLVAYFDAIVEKTFSFEAEVPEYATEKGYKVSESVQRKTCEINVTAFLTNSPVSHKVYFDKKRKKKSSDVVKSVISRLIALYESGDRLIFRSAGVEYKNMVIKSISIPRTSEHWASAEVTLSLKEVRTVELMSATVSEDVDSLVTTMTKTENSVSDVISGLFNGDQSIAYTLAMWLVDNGYIDENYFKKDE